MMPSDAQLTSMLRGGLLGSDTGYVYAWSRASGFEKVPGSDGAFPNGIELSKDEAILYVNLYLAGEVVKLDIATGEVLGAVALGNPDNSSWAADGRLLVALHVDGLLESMACQRLEAGSCGFAFRIVALDPDTMAGESLIRHRGAPMGGATVAVEMDGELFLGTFAGDRIARVANNDRSPGMP